MACGLPELLELDDELLLEEPPLEVHGCTAAGSSGEPRGGMTRVEPSGGVAVRFVAPAPPSYPRRAIGNLTWGGAAQERLGAPPRRSWMRRPRTAPRWSSRKRWRARSRRSAWRPV